MLTIHWIPNPLVEAERRDVVVPYSRSLTNIDMLDDLRPWSRLQFVSDRTGPIADPTTYVPLDGEALTISPRIGGGGGGGIFGSSLFKPKNIALSFIIPGYGLKVLYDDFQKMMKFSAPSVKPAMNTTGGAGADTGVESSPTYSWDGIQSQADVSNAIPIIYGKNRVGGTFINAYITNDDGHNYLNILMAIGEGKLHKIAGIDEDSDNISGEDLGDKVRIEGNPISNFRDVKCFVRLGTDQQSAIPGFSFVHDLYTFDSAKLLKGVPFEFTFRNTDVDTLEIGFKHAALIAYKDGHSEETTFKADIYAKPASGGSYEKIGTYSKKAKSNSEVTGSFTFDFEERGRYTIKVVQTTPNSQPDKYATDTFVAYADEMKDWKLIYPNLALFAMKVLATNQLSGRLSDVEIEVEGLEVDVYSDVDDPPDRIYTNNPIWCTMDLLKRRRYGLGKFTGLHIPSVARQMHLASYCHENLDVEKGDPEPRFMLDIVIDSQGKAFDVLTSVCAAFQAIPVWDGTLIDIIIDKPESTSQLFTMGNIAAGSFSKESKPISELVNLVEVQFANQFHFYKRDTVVSTDRASIESGNPINPQKRFIRGVTRPTQARRMARWILDNSKYPVWVCKFRVATEGVICRAGKIVGVAHDVPGWSFHKNGRVSTGSTVNNIKVQERITLATLTGGSVYTVSVRYADDGTIASKQVSAAPGEYAPGSAISVSSAWAKAPKEYDVYIIHETPIKLFRVLRTMNKSNHETEITAIEYIAGIQDGTGEPVNIPIYTELPDPRTLPAPVSDLKVFSEKSYYPEILVSWKIPDFQPGFGFWNAAKVYISEDSGLTWRLYGDSSLGYLTVLGLKPAKKYKFRVVSVSNTGVPTTFETSPTMEYIPLPELPPVVQGLELYNQGNITEFQSPDAYFVWKEARSNSAIHPAGEEPNGAGSGSRDENIRGYKVAIYTGVQDTAGLRLYAHVETIPASYFRYTFSMNVHENGGVAQRGFTIYVWAEDIYGQLSPNPASLTVNNPLPEAVQGASGKIQVVYAPPFGETDADFANVSWTANNDPDLLGYAVWASVQTDPPILNPTDPIPPEMDNPFVFVGFFGSTTIQVNARQITGGGQSIPAGITYISIAPVDKFYVASEASQLNWNTFPLELY